MIVNNPYAQKVFRKQFGLQKEQILSMSLSEIIDKIQEIKVKGTPAEYGTIKAAIFEVFSQMKDEKGTDYLKAYGKGTIPK